MNTGIEPWSSGLRHWAQGSRSLSRANRLVLRHIVPFHSVLLHTRLGSLRGDPFPARRRRWGSIFSRKYPDRAPPALLLHRLVGQKYEVRSVAEIENYCMRHSRSFHPVMLHSRRRSIFTSDLSFDGPSCTLLLSAHSPPTLPAAAPDIVILRKRRAFTLVLLY